MPLCLSELKCVISNTIINGDDVNHAITIKKVVADDRFKQSVGVILKLGAIDAI